MEVKIVTPRGSDMRPILTEYPDVVLDFEDEYGSEYFIGSDELQADIGEWLTREEAIAVCGFCEGAVAGTSTLLSGNGDWAQGLLRCQDFSGYVGDITAYAAEAAIWRAGYNAGLAQRL